MLLAIALASSIIHFAVSGTSIIQSSVCHSYPSPPVILQPTDGSTTNIAQTTVSGTADTATTITILDNGQSDGATTSDSGGDFALSVPLSPHQNQLIARASNDCNDTADSGAVTITYNPPATPPGNQQTQPTAAASNLPASKNQATFSTINKPPSTQTPQTAASGPLTIQINSPGVFTTTKPSVFLNGITSLAANVIISDNGKQVASLDTESRLSFGVLVPLQLGNNDIVITATIGQHKASIELHITREAPAASTRGGSFWHHYGKLIVIIAASVIIAGIAFIYLAGVKLTFLRVWRK